MNLVTHEKYGPVKLTGKGKKYAKKITCRHQIIKTFLVDVLKVDPEIAERDACLMEHVMSSETIEQLVNFLCNLNKDKKIESKDKKCDEDYELCSNISFCYGFESSFCHIPIR